VTAVYITLRPRFREGECFVFRQEADFGGAEHQAFVDLRSAHKPALHAEGAADDARRSRRFCRLLQTGRRRERAETDRFRRFAHADLVARDKINLDIFWLKDDTLDDPDLLPPPDEIAAEIVENLEAALDRFRKVALSLQA